MKETTYLRLASVWCLVLRNSNSCWRRRRTERSANPWENVQCSMKTWTSSTVKPLAKTCTCLGNIINYSWGSVIVLLEQVEQGCQWSHTTPCSMLVHQVWFLKGEFPIIAPLYSHQFRTICARCFENILGSWKGLQVRFSSAVHYRCCSPYCKKWKKSVLNFLSYSQNPCTNCCEYRGGSDRKNDVMWRHRMTSRHRIDKQLIQNVCLIDILLVS